MTFQGQQVAVQGSKILMSTGDEAGVAMGVVSSMIKGMAEFGDIDFMAQVFDEIRNGTEQGRIYAQGTARVGEVQRASVPRVAEHAGRGVVAVSSLPC